jgi:RPA family protein
MEFNQSKHEVRSEDEYSPSYLLSPIGAQINRILMVGVMTDIQNVGSETQPIWRAKITDPTGVFYVSAGKYQPKLAQTLSGLELMSFVAVVGKSRTYSPQEGTVYVSVRPESITPVDREARDDWLIDAAQSLKKRLDYFREAKLLKSPNHETLVSLGIPEYLTEGFIRALEVYDNGYVEEKFRNTLIEVLNDFLHASDRTLSPEEGEAPPPEPIDEEKEQALEQVMMLLSRLSKDNEMVQIDQLKDQGKKMKIKEEDLEDALATLLENGNIFEPELGYVQMV